MYSHIDFHIRKIPIYEKKSTIVRYLAHIRSSKLNICISKYLTGFTHSDVCTNTSLINFIRANFPSLIEEYFPQDVSYNGQTKTNFSTNSKFRSKKEKKKSKLPKHSIFCYIRNHNETNSRRAKSLRTSNFIPGVVYGSNSDLPSSSDILVKTPYHNIQREISQLSREMFLGRVYTLTIYQNENDNEGTTLKVLPRDIQYHPIWEKIYCVNYIRYHPGRVLEIPLDYVNIDNSPTLKRGGFIAPVSRTIGCVIERGVDIPETIHVDCTCLELGDVIRIDRLIFPSGVYIDKRVSKEDFLVGTVFGKRLSDAE